MGKGARNRRIRVAARDGAVEAGKPGKAPRMARWMRRQRRKGKKAPSVEAALAAAEHERR